MQINTLFSRVASAGLDLYINGPALNRAKKNLDESQWWPSEKIIDYQWKCVKRIIEHAYARIPYYRTRFERAGLTPQDIRKPEDYMRIPIMTKDELRIKLEDLVDPQSVRKNLEKGGTGGSTGEPTPYYHGKNYSICSNAATYRNLRWTGWDFGEKIVQLWGSSFEVSMSQSWRGWISHMLRNTRIIGAFDMSRKAMARYIMELSEFDPALIIGYVEPLYLLAIYMLEQGLRAGSKLKGVISSAGTLYDYQRQAIESAFGCPVFNRYGGRELGDIAHECGAKNGLHVNAEVVFVEVIKDGHPCMAGEEGEIILTSLTNFDMPLIRYAVGDRGVHADPNRACRCGRGLPLLEKISGRVQDVVVTPSGKFVAGEFFPHLFKEIDNVRQFQVVQDSVDQLIIKVAPVFADRPIGLEVARKRIAEFIGEDIKVDFQAVNIIYPGISGKLRTVISHVPINIAGYMAPPEEK